MKKLFPILTVRFCSSLGDQALVYGIPILVFQKTGSMAASGVAFAIEWIPRLIAMPASGAAADIIGSRRLLLSADIFRFSITILVGILFFIPMSITTITLLLGVLGGAVGFFHEMAFVSFETLAPRLVVVKDLPKLHTILQGIDLGTQIVAPGVAALLLLKLNATSFLLALSCLFLCGFLGSFKSHFIRQVSYEDGIPIQFKILHKEIKKQVIDGLKFVVCSKQIMALCSISIAMNFSIGIVLSGSAGYLKKGLGSSAQMAGVLGSLAGCIGLGGFFLIPFFLKKFSLFSLGVVGVFLFFSCNLALSLSQGFWLYGVFFAGLFLADGFYTVFMRTLRVSLIPKEVFSSALGMILCLNFVFMPISGLALAVWGYSPQNYRYLLIASSIFFLVISIISLRVLSIKKFSSCSKSSNPFSM